VKLVCVKLGEVRLVYVSTQEVLFVAVSCVLDFILHILYVIDVCALSLKDMTYCTPEKNTTPVSVEGVGVDF
jgi:hypothetical protein